MSMMNKLFKFKAHYWNVEKLIIEMSINSKF